MFFEIFLSSHERKKLNYLERKPPPNLSTSLESKVLPGYKDTDISDFFTHVDTTHCMARSESIKQCKTNCKAFIFFLLSKGLQCRLLLNWHL